MPPRRAAGPPRSVAAMKAAIAAQKAEEEKFLEEQRLEEARLKAEEEAEKAAQELAEEQRRLRREREKAKIEEQKKAGTYMTEAQKKERARAIARLQAMEAQGIALPPDALARLLDPEAAQTADSPKSRPRTTRKRPTTTRKPGSKADAASTAADTTEETPTPADSSAAAVRESTPEPEPEPEVDPATANLQKLALVDDWEDLLSDEEPAAPAPKAAAAAPVTTAAPAAVAAAATPAPAAAPVAIATPAAAPASPKAEAAESNELRSPIFVVLGHVDAGKTKTLDKIRQSNVAAGEHGRITQQIGATYIPRDALEQKIAAVARGSDFKLRLPGLLMIDTPGHESFSNLRSRGSDLCNIAILVVNMTSGFEPQTFESIRMLKERRIPFVVAMNKIDRLYDWKTTPDAGFAATFAKQTKNVRQEFDGHLKRVILQLSEEGFNASLFNENPDERKYISVVPISAMTGEGIPDLLLLLSRLSQQMMAEKLTFQENIEATILEVKMLEGQGTTIDVILSNGTLREGDRIVVCGLNGPIVTSIRSLLTPEPLKEMRVKTPFIHHSEVKGAMGVKIAAQDLEGAVAGGRVLVINERMSEEQAKREVMADVSHLLELISSTGRGVHVQASTLGSLEALLEFLRQMKIPVGSVAIGTIFKKDVIRASIMLEHQKEYATMLCFDVKIDREAEALTKELGVRVFSANVIYHLFDAFTAYMKELESGRRTDLSSLAIFPCVLSVVPTSIFNKRDPIVIGVTIKEGSLRVGTLLCVPSRDCVEIGRVTAIEVNHKAVPVAKKGTSVAIKIESDDPKTFGRHFDANDEIVSRLSRESINVLKDNFRSEVSKEEWNLVRKLKTVLNFI
ncbi:translation initiation factor 5B [Fonticula alba]|uniref:Eukaryotic translation initiation factor 5B n=1 Tax=Fonticula alba TaxID=691883 RepID=A0A058ZFB6_FONAL|nr:translation initiation factor 5B [Fonticula alba]KCV72646.1 translation initiation factor 5B [Fonticula alba]|eukprot:XP_009492347.1 translation initiation factor 5B [Fonticula alba]